MLLALGGVCIWLDAQRGWTLIIGVLIGLRFVVGGGIAIILSILRWRQDSAA